MQPQNILHQAVQLHQQGRTQEAERLYAEVLRLAPDYFEALHMFGLLRLQQARHEEALALTQAALRSKPQSAETLSNLGLTLRALGKTDAAREAFDRAIAANPAYAPAWNNRGCLLQDTHQLEAARDDFTRTVTVDPAFAEGWNNLGLAQTALRQHAAALTAFEHAIALRADYGEALRNRGAALRSLGCHAEALASLERALALDANDAGAWCNRGGVLWDMDRIDEAHVSFDRAIALRADFAMALSSRAEMLWSRRKLLPPAIADMESLLRAAPDFPYARGTLLHLKMHAGDWDDFDAQKNAIDAGVRAGLPVVEPFVYQGFSDSAADQKLCAEAYAAREFPGAPTPVFATRRPGKIRIGYVCSEFRRQATAYLMAGLFDHHDKSRFEIFAFDAGASDGSPLRARLEAAFDHLIPIAGLTDTAAANAIAAHGIDILVNLNGYFGAMRMGVFALRPAPVQVNYLGFPGTLGADYMDYIVADRDLIAPDETAFYTEQIAWLPHSYQPNDDKRAIGAPTTRAAQGLPEAAFVFCHFNAGYKLTPDIFAIWLRLLQAVPGSVLWLLAREPIFQDNLRREAARQGIDAARVIFAPQIAMEDHLARLALGDLFLDSYPCTAHTTASDALWAGLPLLTCRGGSFSARVAASLLHAVDFPELVTENLQAYEAMALRLAQRPDELAALRRKLADNKKAAPLFDTARYTRDLETAYGAMFDATGGHA